MNAPELYLLGRKLMKIAESALPAAPDRPGAATRPGSPATARLVLLDISEHPEASIGEIAARTGLAQSQVSTSVTSLRKLGVVATSIDPVDGRRTLTHLTEAAHERARAVAGRPGSLDAPLADALGSNDVQAVSAVADALEELAERLIPHALSRLREDGYASEAA